MKIILAADHRGFALKEKIKGFLLEQDFTVYDVGAFEEDVHDDYPDFAYAGAIKVMESPEDSRGIFLCGSGMGMDVVANKVKGIRATIAYSPESTEHARSHDDINVITLAADVITYDEAKDIVTIFLHTDLDTDERHARRLKKIHDIEENNFK